VVNRYSFFGWQSRVSGVDNMNELLALLLLTSMLAEDQGYCELCGYGIKGEVGPLTGNSEQLLVCAVECGQHNNI